MFLSHFAEVFECLLLLLLNMLIDLTDELDVLCRSLATLSTSASLYSILTNQIKFPPPQPGYQVFNFPTTPSPQPPIWVNCLEDTLITHFFLSVVLVALLCAALCFCVILIALLCIGV